MNICNPRRHITQVIKRNGGGSNAKMYIVSSEEAYILKKNLYRDSPNYCIEGPIHPNQIGAKIVVMKLNGKKFWGRNLSWNEAETIFLDAIHCSLVDI